VAALADQPYRAPVLGSETPFSGRVWNVRRDRVDYAGAELVREYVDHPGAVAVLALDEHDRVLLIRQYRHPVGMRELELPAGLLDVMGENPLDAARRELAEEADLAAEEWALLTEFVTSPGSNSEAVRVYLARGLTALSAFARTEEEADLEVLWLPLDDAVDAVLARRIGNSIACIALLAAHVLRNRAWVGLGSADEAWAARPATGG
jgi:ADP-ribose pyrophosphatase